jgi:8-oxo-dGTP diphosphatase
VSEGLVRVAAAIIERADGQVLLAQRPAGKAYAGYWEFPGGKLESGETPRDALDRELAEELGIAVRRAAPWLVQRYRYPHAHVQLHFFRVLEWTGEPIGHDGQAFVWQTPGQFAVDPLLPANTVVLRALTLPRVYGITMADELGEAEFLSRAESALDRGLRLVQLREKAWPIDRQRALAERLVALARPRGAKVLLNGDVASARAWGCDGVHVTARALAEATSRPADLLCGASCHTHAEIERAGALGLDFAVLGPVFATPTHPGATTLGWEGFAALVAETSLPVFALGGLASADLDEAIAHGAHGVALRRAAWR